MKKVGIRFKKTGKLSYYISENDDIKLSDSVVVDTDKGEEIGVVAKVLELEENEELEKVKRMATEKDFENQRNMDEKAKEALKFCKEEAKKLELDMKVLSAEYTLDGTKLTIYFVSEDRVDFRELVKIIAAKYRARIELRQIGPRDEVREYPTLGMCGKEVCCRTHLQNFDPVTIKMAKEQGLQINMSKLSGACGKLMCCLRYEEELYKENLKKLPKVGEIVKVKGEKERAKVTSVDILNLNVKVKFGIDNEEEERYETYPVEELKWTPKQNKKEEKNNNDENHEDNDENIVE
ncbi:MAG: stage 0 sporulation protein [Clostridia bacterium]|nr:stage 0 sporulation protein [Clostridia bacterium]